MEKEKKCKSVKEFDFEEFAAKVGPLKDEDQKNLMAAIKSDVENFILSVRFFAKDGTPQRTDLWYFIDTEGCSVDQKLLYSKVRKAARSKSCKALEKFFDKLCRIAAEMGFVRNDNPFSAEALKTLDAMTELITDASDEILYVLMNNDDLYIHWECTRTAEDVKQYLCKILPPGQGEIIIYNNFYNIFDMGYTNYQKELLEKSEENFYALVEKEGSPLINYLLTSD